MIGLSWNKLPGAPGVSVAVSAIAYASVARGQRETPTEYAGTRSALQRGMTPQELRNRTAQFAVDVTTLARRFAKEPASEIAINQLIRSATGTAANYRAAGHARSHAEFTSRISVALEEADECVHWLEFTERAGLVKGTEATRLLKEAKELAAIFGASRRTAAAKAREKSAQDLAARSEKRAARAKPQTRGR